MSLESKAKTLGMLKAEADRLEWHFDNSALKTKWVPLDEAQKLEADFKLMETETLKQLHLKCHQIEKALKILEQCQDNDQCCLFTDDGCCYDDDCIIAEAKTILKSSISQELIKEKP
jgi:hypothetical protein